MLERELETAMHAAREAGAVIRSVYGSTYTVRYKPNDSPVTTADQGANRRIQAICQQAFPDYGWLSEETVDSSDRLALRRVWVVDPMDGTKEFIQKIPEFAVSIGLIEDGRAVLGVVYHPIQDQMYWATRGAGAWNGARRLSVSTTARLSDATILSSRSESKRGEWQPFRSAFRTRPLGSIALKLAGITTGGADASFTLVPKNEWDICAGTVLIEQAGGTVTRLNGKPLIFNQPITLLQGLVASNGPLHPPLLALIAPRLVARHHAEERR